MKTEDNPQWDELYPTREHYTADIAAGELFVHLSGGEVTGVVCLNSEESPEYEPLPWQRGDRATVIHRMAVAPWCRKQGIGGRLLEFAQEIARENGTHYIKTDTFSENVKMNALFQKHGLRPVGQLYFARFDRPFNCYDKVLEANP